MSRNYRLETPHLKILPTDEGSTKMKNKTPFLNDILEAGARIRRLIKAKAKDGSNGRRDVTAVLQCVLALEMASATRYKRTAHVEGSRSGEGAAEIWLSFAEETTEHADLIASRIAELGKDPNLTPAWFPENGEAVVLSHLTGAELSTENLKATQAIHRTYQELIQQMGDDDPLTQRMLIDIGAAKLNQTRRLADCLPSRATMNPGAADTPANL